MAMFIRSGGGPHSEINMTPMIDVLLVLIIIFMLVSPHERGLDTAVPQPSSAAAAREPEPAPVVTVQSGGGLMLNREAMDRATLGSRLKNLVVNGRGDVLFVRGVGDLDFAQVAGVVDLAHVSGIGRIALMPE